MKKQRVLYVDVVQFEDSMGDMSELLYINGKQKARIYSLSECPEDARIGRGLISAKEIADYILDFAVLMPQFDSVEFCHHYLSKDPDFMGDEEYKAEMPERFW